VISNPDFKDTRLL